MDTEKKPQSIVGKLQKEFLNVDNESESRTLKDTLKHLGETSSLHGISKITSSRQIIVKVLWCILFLGTFTVFIIQITQLFRTFYSYPIQTTVSLEFNSISFPAITLCNMNPVKMGKLNLVPDIEEVLQKEQLPNTFLRKRREATRNPKMNDKSRRFPTTDHSPERDKENAEAISRDKRSLKTNLKESLDNAEQKSGQLLDRENRVPPDRLFLERRGLRRRKRDVSITSSVSFETIDHMTTVTSDSTQFTPHEPTQTATTMSSSVSIDSTQSVATETVLPSSDISQTVQLSSSDSVSNLAVSVINTGSSSSDSSFTGDVYISPSIQSMSVSDLAYSFSLNSSHLSSYSPSPSTSSDFLQSYPSSSLYQSSSYPSSINTWEAWYDYYNNDYHPFFYDSEYNYNDYWNDWYNYGSFYDYDYGGSFFFDQLHSTKDEWDERVEKFRTVFKKERVEKRKEIGHQKEDMIVAASFTGRVENITHFQNFTSTLYGNCYTMTSPKYVAWRSGPSHGIKLTLNLEIDEYVPNFSTGYGIRIVFHEPGTQPLPSHEGITLSPGTETNIGLRLVRISRLGEPHGDCIDGKEFSERYHKRYSISSCHEFCRIHRTILECKCIPVEAPDEIQLNSTALPVCNVSVKAVKACLLEVDVLFDSGEYTCDCRGPCDDTVFAKTMSSTYWPTDDYLEVLISEMCEKYQTPYWTNLCSSFQYMPYWELDRFRYNFLRVLVYFEDLNYETITEEPLYESVRFLSDIGGAMGLFLGASVLSFVEVVQLLLELFLFMKEKHIDNRKTRVLPFSAK